ncbi:hypothetical protein JKP88DRAFT_286957 [Tribonema minus]|uniref:Uncharacterized protein n=1 Tax=Tribonema minus TaxID=303371 RepID=A0A836CKW7_9STRA|nr:hypothetical protein JKP88DRAFT_286957 [Tribonema minus]
MKTCTVVLAGVTFPGSCYVKDQQPLSKDLVGAGLVQQGRQVPLVYLKTTVGASCKSGDLIGVNPATTVDQGGGCQENRCNAIITAKDAGCCPTSPCARRTLLAETS